MEKVCDPTAVGPPSAAVTHSDGSCETSSVSLITVQEFWSAPLHSVASGLDFSCCAVMNFNLLTDSYRSEVVLLGFCLCTV